MASIPARSISVASRISIESALTFRLGAEACYENGRMSMIMDETARRIAERIRAERETRGWSLGDLAERSGVSKAMISKVERGEASPTAVLLGHLSGAFGITLSTLLARAEGVGSRLTRSAEQATWRDPETGLLRTSVSPAGTGSVDV